MSIVLSHVSFSHCAEPLVRDLSLQLPPGWTGLVGPNGAGKTTLLRLVLGELAPDAGSVHRVPADLRARLCPQSVEALSPDVARFAEATDGSARRVQGQLGLDARELDRWPSLSPGERKRWQVGAALHADPHLLLLDEPTNHLDADSRDRLLGALLAYPGLGLVVSHDRALLDALTQHTLRFHRGEIRLWRGGYGVARAAWEREEHEELTAYRRVQGEKRKLRRRLADTRRARDQAEARSRRALRRAGPRDRDTRARHQAKRRRSAVASLGRDIRKLHGRLDRVAAHEGVFDLHKALGRSLLVDWEPASVDPLLHLESDRLLAGTRVLARDVRVALGREDRVHLRGPNGAGKTTLVRALLATARVPGSRLLYLPQELGAEQEAALLEELRATPEEEQGRVLAIVAALGVEPAALLASVRPSPGAARKLALALGLARRVQAMVLDEPTNHLDLPSVERIEAALAAAPGALLVVTHDEAFARRCTRTVWELRRGRLRSVSR